MRVLHFFKTYFPDSVGGIERVIRQLVQEGKELGIENTVLSLSHSNKPDIVIVDGVKVYRCPVFCEFASTPFSFQLIWQFKKLSAESDIIHYHFPYPIADLLHLLFAREKPSVVTYHSDIVRQRFVLPLYKPLERKFLANVDKVVTTSPNYLKTSTVLASLNKRPSVIPIGLDKKNYYSYSGSCQMYWREKFGEKFFLFLGVLRYYKGVKTLIEAAQSSVYPIVIVGAGPERNKLERYAEKLGVTNIHFLGFVSEKDKITLLDLCRAIVFPSHLRSEAFGVSLVEGAMFAKPLISCELGTGTSHVNLHKITGLVVPPADSKSLREAMDLLWDDDALVSRYGIAARQRFLDHFTSDKMGRKYHELYCSILDSKK